MAADEEVREVQRRYEDGDMDREAYDATLRRLGYGWTTDAKGRPMWLDPDGGTLTVSDGSMSVVPARVTLTTRNGEETINLDMPADMFETLRASEALLAVIVAMLIRASVIAFWSIVGSAAVLTAWVRPESGAWVTCIMLLALGAVVGIKARRAA